MHVFTGRYELNIQVLFTLVLVYKMLRILEHRIFGEDLHAAATLSKRKEADILYDRKPVGSEIHCRELSHDLPTPEQGSLQKYNAKLPPQKTNYCKSHCPAITFIQPQCVISRLTLFWNDCYQFAVRELRNIRRKLHGTDIASCVALRFAESKTVTTLLTSSVVFQSWEKA